MKKILVGCGLILSLLACKDSDIDPNVLLKRSINEEVVITDKILFHFSYKNNSWAYENTGQFIDSSGNIFTYEIKKGEKDLIKPKNGYISKDALFHNFRKAKDHLCKIPKEDIADIFPYIALSVAGPLSESRNTSYNQGDLNWFAYHWDAKKRKYRQVLLRSWGDYSRDNLNTNATQMYKRLMHLMNNNCN
ncbi:MAG: hypothetical protein OCD01_14120 [Fibrobacterales bacterium]